MKLTPEQRLARVERTMPLITSAKSAFYSQTSADYAACLFPAVALLHGVPMHDVLDGNAPLRWSDAAAAAGLNADAYDALVATYTLPDPRRRHVATQLQHSIFLDARTPAREAVALAQKRGGPAQDACLYVLRHVYDTVYPRWERARRSYERAGYAERGAVLFPPFAWPFEGK
jgi:GNAT superfamily N-acetyltransferase